MITVTLFWTFVLGIILCLAEAGMMGDQCDWTGSGLSWSSELERGVRPVYLRCGAGSLAWRYPRGALRLQFRPPLPAGTTDFSVCVRVLRRADPPDIFHTEPQHTEAATRFPARLFVEGGRRLVPLYAADDGSPREVRCFRSRRGRAALYVEAEPEPGPERRDALLRYEVRPLPHHYDPATADCRPCSDPELELAFCTSDLVTRGIIVGSEPREDLGTTQLTVRVTQLVRATADGATPPALRDTLDSHDDDYYSYSVDNTVENTRRKRSLHVHVHVDAACGAGTGAGEFLVLARRRLGRYSLVCAPRAHDWERLAKRRTEEGTAHCSLH